MNFSGHQRQKDIYAQGSLGQQPILPFDFENLEKLAKKKLSKDAFGYIATGAGSEFGIANNRNAFKNYQLLPRMAVGVSETLIKIDLFGTSIPAPVLFAPIGVLDLAHKKGDLEVAKASKTTGIPMIFSNQASSSMESCSNILGDSPHWFQLYFSKSKTLVESFIDRAEKCGCKAIVLTLDTTHLGWRYRDLNNAYVPFAQGKGIAQYTSDPVFLKYLEEEPLKESSPPSINFHSLKLLHEITKEFPGSYFQNLFSKKPVRAVRKFIEIFSRPNLNWDDIKWLKMQSKLPIILKGILHPDDAKKAIDLGIDGIIVSNHGGRQVDYVRSSLDSLVEIKKEIPENYPLLLDSGIRNGTDIFISLALGAKAVLLGRPYAYALSIAASKGVESYVQNLIGEFELTMRLTGCKSLEEISRELVECRWKQK